VPVRHVGGAGRVEGQEDQRGGKGRSLSRAMGPRVVRDGACKSRREKGLHTGVDKKKGLNLWIVSSPPTLAFKSQGVWQILVQVCRTVQIATSANGKLVPLRVRHIGWRDHLGGHVLKGGGTLGLPAGEEASLRTGVVQGEARKMVRGL